MNMTTDDTSMHYPLDPLESLQKLLDCVEALESYLKLTETDVHAVQEQMREQGGRSEEERRAYLEEHGLPPAAMRFAAWLVQARKLLEAHNGTADIPRSRSAGTT